MIVANSEKDMQHLFTNWNQVLKRNEKKPKGSVVSAYLQKEKRT
ncbi:unnamed protein product [Callosobruchus maculatus]|uniref:Uncharacterized protein n=1 Tax=Callosobruchus maculatus TaxID=64391 RepID=A0A653BN63_CALMS|nr:unnamed protein product [Callosobruchus maculatus]